MPLTTEEQRLIVTVSGKADVDQLTQSLNAEETTLRELIAAKNAGLISDAAYESQAKRTTAAILANKDALDRAKTALHSYQQNLTGLGYAVNDFFSVSGNLDQRLNAIANNMPMLLSGFGAWGGLLSGLIPIFAMVIKNWDYLAEVFGTATGKMTDRVETLTERIKELEKQPHKVAVDVMELENAHREVDAIKAGLQQIEQLRKSQAYYEKQSGSQIAETIAEEPGGGKAVEAELSAQLAKTATETSGVIKDAEARIQKAREDMAKFGTAPKEGESYGEGFERRKKLKEAQEAERKAERDKLNEQSSIAKAAPGDLGNIIAVAKTGSGAEQAAAQKQIADLAAGVGRGGLAEAIRASSPAGVKADDEEEFNDKRHAEAAHDAGERRRAKRKAEEAEAEAQSTFQDYEVSESAQQAHAFMQRHEHKKKVAKDSADQTTKKAGIDEQRRIDQTVSQIQESSPIDEHAYGLAADMRARGGTLDERTGNTQKLDRDQQFIRLVQTLTETLARLRPGDSLDERRRVANTLARSATDRVDAGEETGTLQLRTQFPGLSNAEASVLARRQQADAARQQAAQAGLIPDDEPRRRPVQRRPMPRRKVDLSVLGGAAARAKTIMENRPGISKAEADEMAKQQIAAEGDRKSVV